MSDEPKKNPPHMFQPGQSGNPAGRPPATAEERALKKLSRHKLHKLINELIHLSIGELRALSKDESQPTMKMMLASIMAAAVSRGDYNRLDFLLNRLIGRVPQKFEGVDGEPMSFVGIAMLAQKKDKPE